MSESARRSDSVAEPIFPIYESAPGAARALDPIKKTDRREDCGANDGMDEAAGSAHRCKLLPLVAMSRDKSVYADEFDQREGRFLG